MYSWILAMRKKPIEERRRFVATLTIAIMAGITSVWFFFFFTGLSEKFNTTDPETVTASVVGGFGGPEAPFSERQPILPTTLPDLGVLKSFFK